MDHVLTVSSGCTTKNYHGVLAHDRRRVPKTRFRHVSVLRRFREKTEIRFYFKIN
jgi:hypothetical protein